MMPELLAKIKLLREKTGYNALSCREALVAANYDMEKAKKILRDKTFRRMKESGGIMSRELHDAVRFCGSCQKPTMHSCEDTGSEEDNYQNCQACNWHTYGPNGIYIPHDEDQK